jgi:hypothetical protein
MGKLSEPATRIALLGGPCDGQEVNADGHLPQRIYMPVPVTVDANPQPWQPPPCAVYRNAGSVRDDGTRVFEYDGQ